MAKNPTATQAIIEAIQNGDPQNVESVLADVEHHSFSRHATVRQT